MALFERIDRGIQHQVRSVGGQFRHVGVGQRTLELDRPRAAGSAGNDDGDVRQSLHGRFYVGCHSIEGNVRGRLALKAQREGTGGKTSRQVHRLSFVLSTAAVLQCADRRRGRGNQASSFDGHIIDVRLRLRAGKLNIPRAAGVAEDIDVVNIRQRFQCVLHVASRRIECKGRRRCLGIQREGERTGSTNGQGHRLLFVLSGTAILHASDLRGIERQIRAHERHLVEVRIRRGQNCDRPWAACIACDLSVDHRTQGSLDRRFHSLWRCVVRNA